MEEEMNTHKSQSHSIGSGQSGQILLIVVLSMVVALTVGLSIASRTISNLKISKQNEESQRAFQAAEAGLERASRQLYGGNTSSINADLQNNASFTVDIDTQRSNQIVLNGNDIVQRAVGLDIWMGGEYPNYDNPFTGRVRLFWGQPDQECTDTGDNYPPALEVLLIYGGEDNPQLLREVYDPCGSTRTPNSVAASDARGNPVEGTTFRYSAIFPISGNMTNAMIIKVIPIYNSTRLGLAYVSGTPNQLPAQGSVITSTGTSGDTVRKITYFQSYPQIPNELFPYTIISQ